MESKEICNLYNLDKRKDNPIQEYYIIEFSHPIEEHERSLLENYKQPEGKESRPEKQENYPKLIKFQRRSHIFHNLTDLKNMLILSFLLLSTLTTASDITVNHEKIVLKKGDEITLKCTSDSEALGKVKDTKYSKH